MAKENLNLGHYIEIVDRIDCINTMIQELLLKHPTITNKSNKNSKKAIIKAQKELNEAYQELGQKTMV